MSEQTPSIFVCENGHELRWPGIPPSSCICGASWRADRAAPPAPPDARLLGAVRCENCGHNQRVDMPLKSFDALAAAAPPAIPPRPSERSVGTEQFNVPPVTLAAHAPPLPTEMLTPRPTLDEAIEALRAVLLDAEHAERWVGVHERAEKLVGDYDARTEESE